MKKLVARQSNSQNNLYFIYGLIVKLKAAEFTLAIAVMAMIVKSVSVHVYANAPYINNLYMF